MYICGENVIKEYLTLSNTIPALTSGTLLSGSLSANNLHKGSSGVTYTFITQINNPIHDKPKIEITFPTFYNLLGSNPIPTCSAIGLKPLTISGISCIVDLFSVIISNFQDLETRTSVTIFINDLKNPFISSSGDFKIETKSKDGFLIDIINPVSGLSFDDPAPQGNLRCYEISSHPSNQLLTADYKFSFKVASTIKKGGYINIGFPNAFTNLPVLPDCSLENGFLDSCDVYGSSIRAKFSNQISGDFVFWIRSIKNPVKGLTENFNMFTEYDGVVLDVASKTNLPQNVLDAKITETAGSITVSNLVFYPRNEGQLSTYDISVYPSTSFDSDQNILIKFPVEYDLKLGENIECTGNVDLSCENIYEREIKVTLLNGYTYCISCSIDISIYGIKNPRHTGVNTGYFELAVASTNNYLQHNFRSGFVFILESPGLMQLNSLRADNLLTRNSNSFNLNITMFHILPRGSLGGMIHVYFPDEYSLKYAEIECSTSGFWKNGYPSFSIYKNTIQIEGNDDQYYGDLEIIVGNVPNPLYANTYGSLIAYSYDSKNYNIIERTYSNVNYFDFTFEYPGPVIKINNDEVITVEAGSSSDQIYITLIYPSALNLVLTPTCESFMFTPNLIVLSLGQVKASFRVIIPELTLSKNYIIKWSMSGELAAPFYTPIFQSYLFVTNHNSVGAVIDNLVDIPILGTSFPLYFTLDAAPAEDLTISLEVSYSDTGINVTPSFLYFTSESKSQIFYLSINKDVKISLTTPKLIVKLGGTNKAIYKSIPNEIEFKMTNSINAYKKPFVIDLAVSEVSKTSGQFTLKTNKECMAYYAISLYGTPVHSFLEIKNKKITSTSGQTRFGELIVGENLKIIFEISELKAETVYAIDVWLLDMLGTTSNDAFSYNFRTSSRHSVNKLDFNLNQTFATKSQISEVKSALRTIFSLPDSRLIDISQSHSNYSEKVTLSYYITDDLSNSYYPSPAAIATRLNNRAYSKLVPFFDYPQVIQSQTFYAISCSFENDPIFYYTSSFSTIKLSISLIQDGYIYAVAFPAYNNTSAIYPQQIVLGYDTQNNLMPSSWSDVEARIPKNLTLSNLIENTIYNIYVTCGNSYPGDPEISKGYKFLEARTKKKPDPIALSLNRSTPLKILLWVYLIAV